MGAPDGSVPVRAIVRVGGRPAHARLADALGSQKTASIVVAVLRGLRLPEVLTTAERALAAGFYREVAQHVRGRHAADAAQFNVARARYLEGGSEHPPGTLPAWQETR